jgi:N-acetyl sugar amidotransferase
VCSACIGHYEKEKVINWDERRKSLEKLFDEFRGKGRGKYDCIVPVSGGKDSTYQTYMVKEVFKMTPLCVTYRTPLRTELGQKNLDNMIERLGVDHIDLRVDPEVERKFVLKALKKVGDCGLPEHMGIFAFTLRAAIDFKIPLVVWGECSELEYGGSEQSRKNLYLDREWLAKHGCLQETTEKDWVDESLTLKDMYPFMVPTAEELKQAEVCSFFLGQFIKWDPVENARVAKSLGFQCAPKPVMGIYDFADLDCKLIVAHHYVKWLKFGMTRTFDNVSIEIRNGRMTRKEGIDHIVRNGDDPIPQEHMDSMCSFLGITEKQFYEIIEPFRNLKIWQKDKSGNWHIPGYLQGLR